MRVNNFFLTTIIFLYLFSCTSNKKDTDSKDGIYIDIERNDEISCFDIFSEINIVPLETLKESTLGLGITKIKVHKDNYYVLDEKQHSIFVFNQQGKFIKKINHRGKGPGEYSAAYDFFINRFTGNLEILSPEGNVYTYDSMGDSFIENIKLDRKEGVIYEFINLTEDVYVFFCPFRDGKKMYFYSKSQGKKVADAYAYDISSFIYTNNTYKHTFTPFYVYRDSVFFCQVYNGTLFNISASDYILRPKYKWDFGEHNFDISIIPEDESREYYSSLSKLINSKYAVNFLGYAENDSYYITRFRYKNIHKHILYDKKKNQYLLFEKFKEGFDWLPLIMDNDYSYILVDNTMRNLAINPQYLDEENRRKYDSIGEEDNQFIIRFKFK